MKKLLLLIVCIFVIYGLLIFLSPETSSKIESMFGFSGATDKVQNFKKQFDNSVTDIPSVGEFKSGALDIRDTIQGGLDTTKDKIDGVRSTLSGAQDTFNNTMDTVDSVVETVKTAKETVEKINDGTKGLQDLGESLKGSVNTEDVSQ